MLHGLANDGLPLGRGGFADVAQVELVMLAATLISAGLDEVVHLFDVGAFCAERTDVHDLRTLALVEFCKTQFGEGSRFLLS